MKETIGACIGGMMTGAKPSVMCKVSAVRARRKKKNRAMMMNDVVMELWSGIIDHTVQ